MKTAISVPDATYHRAANAARKLGVSRSQFYSHAADRYAAEVESDGITEAVNAVVAAVGHEESARFAVSASRRLFDAADDQW